MHALPLLASLVLFSGCGSNPSQSETGDTASANDGAVVGIALSPYNPSLSAGDTIQFEAKAFFSDGSHADQTGTVTWVSSNERAATINASGLATAGDPGNTDIIATSESGISAKVSLTIKAVDLQISAVNISPEALTFKAGDTAQLTATATYSDDSTGNITAQCRWTSANDTLVSVTDLGFVTAVAVGDTNVEVDCAGQTVSVPISVESAEFVLPLPDLKVSDFTTVGSIVGRISYNATVRNEGPGYAGAFWVQAYADLSASPRSNDVEDTLTWVPGLPSGESALIDLSSNGHPPGTYQSWIAVDLLAEVEESDEHNNILGPVTLNLSPATGRPDLVLTEFIALGDSSSTLYQLTVTNNGTDPADFFWMDLMYNPSSDPVAGVDMLGDDFVLVPTLLAGESFVWETDAPSGPSSAQEWRSCVVVDSMLDIDESNETNNVKCDFVSFL